MKITTTKEKLLNGILMAERITGKKESLPILSCVLMESGRDIKIRATNLEAGIEVSIAGDVDEKGIVAVPATILSQTIRAIGGDRVILSSEDGNLLVESRGTKTLIKAVPHEEFPVLSSDGGKREIQLARERLIRGIQAVSYAASPSMIRPDLGSITFRYRIARWCAPRPTHSVSRRK
jgi:DNA polymerase III sliding clamp (beta) subunit (PCNA family)